MSPEQLSGDRVTAASDIFSLGLVLYRLLTGRHPFATAEDPHAHMRALLHALLVHTPRPPHHYRASVPPALGALVLRMLEKDPAARPPAGEISRVLRAPTTLGSVSTERPGGHGAQHHNLAGTRERSPHDQVYESLAVLPFVNAAGDEDTESLCEGIAETLINHFSHTATLRVVARSTAFRYKGNEDVQKVSRELGVSAILSGRLVKRGDTLRIQAELIDPLTNTQLWGQKYDRQLRDLFAVEEEIARRISSALQLKFVPRTGEHLARRYTDNLEAYQLCLKGRFFWSKRTRDALARAIECYRGAIELEPSYALAYSGLADCYHVLGSFLMLPPGDAFPRARGAARRALEIDADIVAARVTQASVSAFYDRDHAASDRQFIEAIGANPDYPEARQWYGLNLCVRGRFDEGLDQLLRAQQLDALSPMLNAQLASGYYMARRYAEAEDVLRKTLEIEGSFGPAHWFLGKVKSQQGDAGGAVAELQAAVDSTGRGSVFLATHGWALGAFGRSEEAERVLQELRTRSQHEYVSSICYAYIHAGLGDNVAAIARLREALSERSFFALWIAVEPMFDPLRGDPGFDALVDTLKRPAV
jgi:TolB-like protein/Tfp pilus assembly protein PilF